MSDYFPEEVLIMILVRLPTKSLLICTSVCKSWRSLITSPSFITTHLNAHQNNPTKDLIYRKSSKRSGNCQKTSPERYWLVGNKATTFGRVEKLEFPFRAINSFFRILDCINGVLCLADDLITYTDTIILWNPMIRKSVSLPKPSFTFSTHDVVLGFGFDHTANDYKIVRMLYPKNPDVHDWNISSISPPDVELYSLSTGSWKTISPPGCPHVPEHDWSQAFVNGAVHWLASYRIGDELLVQILSFSLSSELFGEVLLPTCLSNSNVVANMSVAVFGGFLSLLPYARFSECHGTIWVMKEYGAVESWTKLFSIDDNLVGPYGRVLPVGNNRDSVLLVTTHKSLRYYDLMFYDYKTHQTIYLEVVEDRDSVYLSSYTESLVLLDKGKGAEAGGPYFSSSFEENINVEQAVAEAEGIKNQLRSRRRWNH